MTTAHLTPEVRVESVDDAVAALKAEGLRVLGKAASDRGAVRRGGAGDRRADRRRLGRAGAGVRRRVGLQEPRAARTGRAGPPLAPRSRPGGVRAVRPARAGVPDLRALRQPPPARPIASSSRCAARSASASATSPVSATSRSPASARPARPGRRSMSFDSLFGPVEHADEWLTGLFDGAPLLRGAGPGGDPRASPRLRPRPPRRGHLADGERRRRLRQAVRLGAWWGLGHATMLLAIGLR